MKSYVNRTITRESLGNLIPRRGGVISPPLGKMLLKLIGWRVVGEIPNIKKAVVLAVPHTSNFDAVPAIPTILALDFDIKIMGKKSLFKNSIARAFLNWVGIIPIDRSKKGSVLNASIDKIKRSDAIFLGLAPEGTRGYSKTLKTGFYYIAHGANVPILPAALDYDSKEVRFMTPIMPTGDIDADLPKILSQYRGITPKHPKRMAQALQDASN